MMYNQFSQRSAQRPIKDSAAALKGSLFVNWETAILSSMHERRSRFQEQVDMARKIKERKLDCKSQWKGKACMGFTFLALRAFLCKSTHLLHFLQFHHRIHKIHDLGAKLMENGQNFGWGKVEKVSPQNSLFDQFRLVLALPKSNIFFFIFFLSSVTCKIQQYKQKVAI